MTYLVTLGNDLEKNSSIYHITEVTLEQICQRSIISVNIQ